MGAGDTAQKRSLVARMFPHVRETPSAELYRATGRIRVIVAVGCMFLNIGTVFSIDSLGVDPDVWIPLQLPNTVLVMSACVLGALMWKRQLRLTTLRRMTQACVVIELGSFLINLSMFGSVNSHMLFAAIFLVLVYRAVFDFRIGMLAFLVLLIGQWALVIAEVTGLLTPQSAVLGLPDAMYLSGSRQVMAGLFVTGFLVVAFWGVNLAVLRLRHRERAIRILRETLAANEAGALGRHTGRMLNDTYVVGAQIGVGGMGEVYRGEHRRTRRPIAIKLLHPHLVDDPVLLARFQREAEIVGSIGSEHIVRIIDVAQHDDQPFMVLELLEGQSLRERIDRGGPMSPEDAAELFTQLGRGLDAAHAADVVHRDLKPENVFLVPEGERFQVKILDFGVSKIRGNATAITQEVALLGTPDFMSPEQAVGAIDDVDKSADIFALGGILYFVLTGARPFTASSVPALLRTICDEEPAALDKRRPDLGERAEALQAVLRIAMAKKAEQRYGSASELASDLRAAVEGTLEPKTLARATRVSRGKRTASIVGDAEIGAHDDTAHAAG